MNECCKQTLKDAEETAKKGYEQACQIIAHQYEKICQQGLISENLLSMLKENKVIHDFSIKDDHIGIQPKEESDFLFLMLPK
jgi:uncharacterized protein YdhG (YjbR/CyaY superfamily)